MPELLQIPPFVATITDGTITFRFAPEALQHGFAYPPDMVALIRDVLAPHDTIVRDGELLIDLEGLPAISSKQLGAMLAVRSACRPRQRIRVQHTRANVRELLEITHLNEFFTWDDASASNELDG